MTITVFDLLLGGDSFVWTQFRIIAFVTVLTLIICFIILKYFQNIIIMLLSRRKFRREFKEYERWTRNFYNKLREEEGYACAYCSKTIDFENVRGTMKHPICKKCYLVKFNNDYDKYYKDVILSHASMNNSYQNKMEGD